MTWNAKCDKCQKKNLETWYAIINYFIKNPTDWMPEIKEYEKEWIRKAFCSNCWKKERNNYQGLSWDSFNWRCEQRNEKN